MGVNLSKDKDTKLQVYEYDKVKSKPLLTTVELHFKTAVLLLF
jgi:hypothetical protein